jgi:ubiquitin-protein ligase
MAASNGTTANKRIQKELQNILSDNTLNLKIKVIDANLLHWHAEIAGPDDSPYANGLFRLDINFPPDYPFNPPKVRFITKVYHCNINASGGICLDILKDQWSPGLTISKVNFV